MVIKIFPVFLWHEITTTGRFPGNAKKIKAMRAKTTISDFRFEFAGYGHYKVTYTSPVTGKSWTAKGLNDLYKRLENFIADCTRSEVDANRDALNKVQSMIHQRMILTNK